MRARVSNLEAFRQWRADETATLDALRFDIPETEAMRAGTAFHRALETAPDGEHDALHANGYRFILPDGTLRLPKVRELRAQKAYGPLTVSGCVDAIRGRIVTDHKTTGRCDPERYFDGYQWRLYLDIFEADVFEWLIYEIRELQPMVYEVADPQVLRQFRYPGMSEDCADLAADYYRTLAQLEAAA